ncbi:serine protease [Azospirillum sp. YIM B02556]|uniref:Serine protease n=1 Tax=Azospirillum endophyticum TaxID=2800326 RepID=A0ABS1F5Y3_9PROT|nr:serine protease [Azospirillum endophyticum]MBK1838804.1 serine protease [Azospirillum endophyticum]
MTTHPLPSAAVLLLLCLPPAGCGGLSPPPQAVRTAPPVARGTTAPLRFGELTTGSMRRGMQIGRYVWDIDCAPPYDDVYWTSGVNMRRGSTFEERFGEVMTATGFDVVGRPGGPDNPDGNRSRARFTVQGDLRDVQLELCHRTNWLTGSSKGSSGTGSVRVEWTVYDARGGGLVHRLVTTGATVQDRGVPQGETMLVEEAFAAAVEALAADDGLRALLSGSPLPASSVPPPAFPGPARPATAPAGSGPTPLTPALVAAPTPAVPAAAAVASDRLLFRAGTGGGRTAAARIPVGRSLGLVIGETDVAGEVQAVLLAPLPGSDPTVAVRPARGVELTGWVVRRDAASGFALVRVPARLAALPVRTGSLRVSEPVRAVPRGHGREIAGIVGGLPADGGRGATLIQADLGSATLFTAVTESGDPLLDATGALVGVAPSAGRSVATPAGLVEFLALGSLLDRLGADPVGVVPAPAMPRQGKTRRGGAADPMGEPAWDDQVPDGDPLDGDLTPPT